jgi:hypothetical protein
LPRSPAYYLRRLLSIWLLLASGLASLLFTLYLASLGHSLHVQEWERLRVSYRHLLQARPGREHAAVLYAYREDLPRDLWTISISDGFAISELHAHRTGPTPIRAGTVNPDKEEKKYYLPAEYEAMKSHEAAVAAAVPAAMKAMLRAPAWSQYTDQELLNLRNQGGSEVALGWPFRWLIRSYPAMWSSAEQVDNGYMSMANHPSTMMALKLGLWVARNHPEYIRIWWPGLIGNFLLAMPVSMAVLGSIRLGFVAVRRSMRRRRGVCGSCGYPIQPGSDRCPECGEVHSLPIV